MTEPRYEFFDRYGRPYHHQVYLSGGDHVQGAYIDSVELAFSEVLTPEQAEQVVQTLHAFAGEGAVQRVAWPEDRKRLFCGLSAEHYHLDRLLGSLAELGLTVEHSGCFYSGRLGKTAADVGSRCYRPK